MQSFAQDRTVVWSRRKGNGWENCRLINLDTLVPNESLLLYAPSLDTDGSIICSNRVLPSSSTRSVDSSTRSTDMSNREQEICDGVPVRWKPCFSIDATVDQVLIGFRSAVNQALIGC